jgi:hypothetical protein
VELARVDEVALVATAAPLLPRQLRELCESTAARCAVAVSSGNRLERSSDGTPQRVQAASRDRLGDVIAQVQELTRP